MHPGRIAIIRPTYHIMPVDQNHDNHPEVFNLFTVQSLWFAVEMGRPLTPVGRKSLTTGVLENYYRAERLWNKRPDGIVVKMSKVGKRGEFVILEFKQLSDVTENCNKNYLTRAKETVERQYVS